MEKPCFLCKKKLRLPNFSYCQKCRNKKNVELFNIRKAKYSPEKKDKNRELHRKHSATYQEKNREKINSKRRLENVEDPETFKAKTHSYYQATKKNRHPLLSVYRSMISRCYNGNDGAYQYYGGRTRNPIKICARWLESEGFDHFVEDMYPHYQPGLTIERKNVDGDYEPGNCSWEPMSIQMNNTRKQLRYKLSIPDNSPMYRDYGDLVTIKDFAEEHKLPLEIARYRYAQNWDRDWILSDNEFRRYHYEGRNYTLTELTILSGFKFHQLHLRINVMGWSVEKAMTIPIGS